MMAGSKYEGHHLDPTSLQFSVFSSQDIKRLSVAKIMLPNTMDVLGRALPGGLYDPAMGPYDRDCDPCATCHCGIVTCPGHVGHIELCMLTYNPVFTSTIYSLLRITCLSCFKLQLSEHVQQILELQLKLINAGFVIEAEELDVLKSEMGASKLDNIYIKTEEGSPLHPKIAECIELLQKCPKNPYLNENNKNIEARRLAIISTTMKSVSRKNCMHCKAALKRVKYSYKTLMISIPKAEMEQIYNNEEEPVEGDPSTKVKVNIKDKSSNKSILADECREYFRTIYGNYPQFLKLLLPILETVNTSVQCPCDIFFTNVIPVTPPIARPAAKMDGRIIEHPQTVIYKRILLANAALKAITDLENLNDSNVKMNDELASFLHNVKGETKYDKLYNLWRELQSYVDETLDVNMSQKQSTGMGLKQILEKKEGIIRMNMMGKRVNYAARTVITPDPNVGVDEIGIPEIFAKKLTYPVPVTNWNISELRKLIMNGPGTHPGANFIEDDKGKKTVIPVNEEAKRESLAKLLCAPSANKGVQIVHRHLINGDILLLNRQPTLHRPSIMAHKARILKGEKTFRLHYSNCKSYNADFDGDEMNAHCPQNELGRSEGYNLVNVPNQYLVPKDGTPLGGLIQDHIIAGVRLTMRGRFFNREDYQQLVFQGLRQKRGEIKLLPPAIIKPAALWSGKQVISTVIINLIPDHLKPINLKSIAKIGSKFWENSPPVPTNYGGTPLEGNDMSESEVVFREGQLLVGVLDKMHYGSTAYGLIHCIYELYGGECSSAALTSLARLFTYFLQWEGFTLGVEDILVFQKEDKKRQEIIKKVRKAGNDIASSALNLPGDVPKEVLYQKMDEAYNKDPKFRTVLDRKYKSALDNFTNDINKVCVPKGLIRKFPDNNLQLMITSGAKGSAVNAMQISSCLGQIELEGKRPPLMISGKSLPSFSSFETSPKSGGFIDGRFMTGIQPQDYFFHCMAGREGLIDTAVKTSRSGYLQRCLIKHLEGLSVNYDLTVRDSDNSVIQFLYGEDGMDIGKCQFLKKKQLSFLDDNSEVILRPNILKELQTNEDVTEEIQSQVKRIKLTQKRMKSEENKRVSPFTRFCEKNKESIEVRKPKKMNKETGRRRIDESLCTMWKELSEDDKAQYSGKKTNKCPDPVIAQYSPDSHYQSISEYLENLIANYTKENPERKAIFRDVINIKSMSSLAPPGEPVGLLAAQSIGEPSTQMTLNTFHFAGRGEMNVTLGIPRLREILMLASKNIKTPSMDIPFKNIPNLPVVAEKLRQRLARVTVADVLETIHVHSELVLRPTPNRKYRLKFTFLPRDAYKNEFCVKPKQILKYMSTKFFKIMFRGIEKALSQKNYVIDFDVEDKPKKQSNEMEVENEDLDEPAEKRPEGSSKKQQESEESSEDEVDDEDATVAYRKTKQTDERDYDEPEGEEEQPDEDNLEDNEDQEENEDELKADQETLNVLKSNEFTEDYKFDEENHLWCELTFHLPVEYKSMDLTNTMKEVAQKAVIWEVPKIKRAITYDQNKTLTLKTEGINIIEMFQYNKLLDLNRLYSNDIHGIAETYGIEAAGRVLVREVQNVFKVYGITVDPRHLLLISDYMTFEGTIKALSRKGMESSASPLQQMSFESCMRFLKMATVSGRNDNLASPSSCLIVGQPCKTGTGCFDLINNNEFFLKEMLKKQSAKI